MSEFELWCLSIDADGEIIGEPFVVRIASSKTIAHLKQEVWPRDPILSSRLVVWKLNGLSHDDFLKEPHSSQSLISQAKGVHSSLNITTSYPQYFLRDHRESLFIL